MKKSIVLLLFFLLLASNMQAQNTHDENSLRADDGQIIRPTNDENIQELPPPYISKQIVGTDDRVDITGKAKGYQQAAVIIEKNGAPKCSGAMIDSNIVLTAAHCLINKSGPVTDLTVLAVGMPAFKVSTIQNSSDIKQNIKAILSSHAATQSQKESMAKQKKVLWSIKYEEIAKKNNWNPSYEASNYDYGFIILDTNLGEKTGWFGVKTSTDDELKNKAIATIGKGYDKKPRTLWYSPGKIGDTKYVLDKRFDHSCDMLGGNSGGPIIATDNPDYIIGVNVSEISSDYYQKSPKSYPYPNIAKRVTKDMIQTINAVKQEYSTNK